MKLTKKQIEIIKENTPKALKGQQIGSMSIDYLGYYQKASANWRYIAGFTDYNGVKVLVVTVFGEVL